jgi:hypothetical protein
MATAQVIKMKKWSPKSDADKDAITIGDLCTKARSSMAESIKYLVDAGKQLTMKKAKLGHGKWLPWIKENKDTLGIGIGTAGRLIKLAANSSLTTNLDETRALEVSRAIWGNEPKAKAKKKAKIPKAKKSIATRKQEPELEEDTPDVIWRRGIINRANIAAGDALYEDWSEFKADKELVDLAKKTAKAWIDLATYLETLM